MKNLYVIKFDNGEYWMGNNTMSPQLRHAKIYTSLKMTKQVAEECIRRFPKEVFKPSFQRIKSYKIFEVEMTIKEEVS